ncbi:gluconate 2-dehydrogenase subunit 3 family protein [Tenacibaculum sp. UWU-22]|uniref:gluconate 2-dehydrogenase subunit 3 family protein n=1 Tax=Tenacibaculum sp. UWU-22 TaxID=3234187 RepID=UPI0034DB1CDF
MERREAVKNIALGLGVTIATPTLLEILSSCSSDVSDNKYHFFTATQAYMVTHLADIILPISPEEKTAVKLVPFIDKMIFYTDDTVQKEYFTKGSKAFEKTFTNQYQKKADKGNKTEYKQLVDTYFSITEKQQKNIFEKLTLTSNRIKANERENVAIYHFLTTTRKYVLLGYYTSKTYDKNHLNY